MAGESAQQLARRARDKAGRLEAYAAACEAGSAGEAATASLLDQLPPGWSAVHDVRWPGRQRANVDHVVVGPGGIFVVDSKNWSGGLTLTDGILRQNGHRRERELAGAADAATAVAEVVAPHAASVQAVICFTGQARLVGRAGDVALCHLENLWRFLLTRPVVLDPQQVEDARARLAAALVPAARPGDAVAATRPVRRAASPAASRPRRSAPSSRPVRGLLVGLVMVLGVLCLGPGVLRSVGAEAARVVVPASDTTACGTGPVAHAADGVGHGPACVRPPRRTPTAR